MTKRRMLLDACVLFPTVMREVLLAVADEGLFEPRWSPRILEEWARATVKLGDGAEAIARGEIVQLGLRFPVASIRIREGIEGRLWLPDPADVHVLAAAISGSCDAIVTMNVSDFPLNLLREEGIERVDPDGFLYGLWLDAPESVERACARVSAEAERLSGMPWEMRKLMKKARLPRLGKALA